MINGGQINGRAINGAKGVRVLKALIAATFRAFGRLLATLRAFNPTALDIEGNVFYREHDERVFNRTPDGRVFTRLRA